MLALPDFADAVEPETRQRALNGLALRVEDLRLEHHIDDDLGHARNLSGRDETLAGQAFVGLDIFGTCPLHDLRWQWWRRGRAVPSRVIEQPVPDVLLVVGGLRTTGMPICRRPEPRRVGGQHLVAESKHSGSVVTELDLGVGEDDAGFLSELG